MTTEAVGARRTQPNSGAPKFDLRRGRGQVGPIRAVAVPTRGPGVTTLQREPEAGVILDL